MKQELIGLEEFYNMFLKLLKSQANFQGVKITSKELLTRVKTGFANHFQILKNYKNVEKMIKLRKNLMF